MPDNGNNNLEKNNQNESTKKRSFFGGEINLKTKDLLDFRYNTQEEIDKLNEDMATADELDKVMSEQNNGELNSDYEKSQGNEEPTNNDLDDKSDSEENEENYEEAIEGEVVGNLEDEPKDENFENKIITENKNTDVEDENDGIENESISVDDGNQNSKESENDESSESEEESLETDNFNIDEKVDELENSNKFFDPFELNFDENNGENEEEFEGNNMFDPFGLDEDAVNDENNEDEEKDEEDDSYGENIQESNEEDENIEDETEDEDADDQNIDNIFDPFDLDEDNDTQEVNNEVNDENEDDVKESKEDNFEEDNDNNDKSNEDGSDESKEPIEEDDNENIEENNNEEYVGGISGKDEESEEYNKEETEGNYEEDEKNEESDDKNIDENEETFEGNSNNNEEVIEENVEENEDDEESENEEDYNSRDDIIINNPTLINSDHKDGDNESFKNKKVKKNSATGEVITNEEIELEQGQDLPTNEDEEEYVPTAEELFEQEPEFFGDDELSQQFMLLVQNARGIFKLQHKAEEQDPYFKILGGKTNNSTLEYLFYLIEEEDEPVDLFIKKVNTDQESGEEDEHLVQFSYSEEKKLDIFVDEVILYEGVNKSDSSTSEYIDTSSILEKFIFLTETYYKELKAERDKQYEEKLKKKQLQQIFKGF